jgi:hypothetical protein
VRNLISGLVLGVAVALPGVASAVDGTGSTGAAPAAQAVYDYATYTGDEPYDYATYFGEPPYDYATYFGEAPYDYATFGHGFPVTPAVIAWQGTYVYYYEVGATSPASRTN